MAEGKKASMTIIVANEEGQSITKYIEGTSSHIAYVLDEAGIYSNDLVELLEGNAKIEA